MKRFNLLCWIPSKKDYFRIKELTLLQYELILKYILNNDDEGLENCFEEIIKLNLGIRDLNKFDKWFILSFLRAVCISPVSVYKVKTRDNTTAIADISILEMLEKISDKSFKEKIFIETSDLKLVFTIPQNFYSKNILKECFSAAYYNNTLLNLNSNEKDIILDKMSSAFKQLIKNNISKEYDDINFKLISRLEEFNIKVPYFKLTDNTLFDHVKRLYSVWSNVLQEKKYILIGKIGFSLNDIHYMTPLECEVYINHYKQEQKVISKKLKSP
jgi:hypothetical protein